MAADELNEVPQISVVIPVHNGGDFLADCLQAVFASDFASFEVIVVDDASTDESAAIARQFPCTLIESPMNVGAAAARNQGAAVARAPVFFFLDADILAQPNTLRAVASTLSAHAELAALFGSFGAKTVPQNFCSRYKNLVHHFTHQHSSPGASTFCSGFGAIRREAFQRLGGFAPQYRFLEDIELGYRMHRHGMRVRLCKEIQLTHCKHYSFSSLVRSDLFGRAIPWTRLMLERMTYRDDLNTQWNNVLSVPVALLLLAVPVVSLLSPASAIWLPFLFCLFVVLNARFLLLTYSEGGLLFAASCLLMCWFTYIYSAVGVVVGALTHWIRGPKAATATKTGISET